MARETYELMGFRQIAQIEALRVLKMADSEGRVIELVQGNWHPHIAVNWLEDADGNYIEIVKEIKYPEEIKTEAMERRKSAYDRDNSGDRHKP